MALERVPADIRKDGGVARMSDPKMIKEIKAAVTIPVMAKARIGHFVECQILQEIGADYIDESEVLTMADEDNHTNKNNFTVPFVCGCRNLGEALRRVAEGAAMIRTKGEVRCKALRPSALAEPPQSNLPPFLPSRQAGTGNVVEAVRHARTLMREIKLVQSMDENELYTYAKQVQSPPTAARPDDKHPWAARTSPRALPATSRKSLPTSTDSGSFPSAQANSRGWTTPRCQLCRRRCFHPR